MRSQLAVLKPPKRNEKIGRACSPPVSRMNAVAAPKTAESATPARISVTLSSLPLPVASR